jgi:hypothetical protein
MNRTMRVHWLLQELNLTYETHRIESRTGETASAEYISLNPKKKTPTLRIAWIMRLFSTNGFSEGTTLYFNSRVVGPR